MDVPAPAASARRLPNAGSAVAAVCAGLTLAGLAAGLSIGPRAALNSHLIEDGILALVWAGLAALLARRARGNPLLPVFLVTAAAAAVATAGNAYAHLALATGLDGAFAGTWFSSWPWVISTFLPVTVLLLCFPDGWPSTTGQRILSWAAVAAIFTVCLAITVAPELELIADEGGSVTFQNPLALPGSGALLLLGFASTAGTALLSVAIVTVRLLRSAGERRRQLAPVTVAAWLQIPGLTAGALLADWAPLIQVAVTPLLPIAVAIAILRYRLYDVEVVVRRSVLFLGLTAMVVAAYGAAVATVTLLLNRDAGWLESLVPAVAVALAFQPIRSALQRFVSRGIYGDRDQPRLALATVGAQLAGAADPAIALAATTAQLTRTLRVPWVAVEADGVLIAPSGSRPSWLTDAQVERIPLLHLGVSQGELLVASRSPVDPLTKRDRRLLEELAVTVAAVLAAGRLNDELRRSREQLVIAREEERRRIRRDLHDDLGPQLSAIAMQADAATLSLERSPAKALESLDRVRATSRETISTLRRVVEGLRPAGVDTLGLLGALHELAAALTAPGTATVTVHAAELPPFAAAVESAIVRIAGEAAGNAIRHGGARRVEIRVEFDGGAGVVTLTVVDDGSGFDPAVAIPGVGIRSMRARAEELGGRFEIGPAEQGTQVRAVLPAHREALG